MTMLTVRGIHGYYKYYKLKFHFDLSCLLQPDYYSR